MSNEITYHSAFASLDIYFDSFDPKEISEILNLTPQIWMKKGNQSEDGSVDPFGSWSFDTSDDVDSKDIVEHIQWLLNKIEPRKAQFLELMSNNEFEARINCFWIMEKSNEILTLSPQIIFQLSSLKIKVEFSIFQSEIDDE